MNRKKLAEELIGLAERVGEERRVRLTARFVESQNIDEKVTAFLAKHPDPSDSAFHAWAEDEGLDVHKAESAAYKIASMAVKFLNDGRANKEKVTKKDVDAEELKIGMEIEAEHSPDEATRERIGLDHLAENPESPLGYYTMLVLMEKIIKNAVGMKDDQVENILNVLKALAGEAD